MTDSIFATERHAAGLARDAIRQWHTRIGDALRRCATINMASPSTGKGVRKLVQEFRRALEPVSFSLTQVNRKGEGPIMSVVLPDVTNREGVDYLDMRLAILRFEIGIGHRVAVDVPLLLIHPHALARMFLRLQATEFAVVRREIESLIWLARAVSQACERLQLRQCIFITENGAFRCDVEEGSLGALVFAKTWISNKTLSAREVAAGQDMVEAFKHWLQSAEHGLAEFRSMMWLAPIAPEALVDAIAHAWERHTWLREPHEEKPDYLTALWEAARNQQVEGR